MRITIFSAFLLTLAFNVSAASRTVAPKPPFYPCGLCSNTAQTRTSFLDRMRSPFYKQMLTASLDTPYTNYVVGILPCPPHVLEWQATENGPALINYTTNGETPSLTL